MKGSITERTERGRKAIDVRLKRLISWFPSSKDYVMEIDLEEEYRIVRFFPLFLVICVVFWMAMLVYDGRYTTATVMQSLCLSFMICFAVLGVFLYPTMARGPLRKVTLLIFAALFAFLVMLVGEATMQFRLINAMKAIFDVIGVRLGDMGAQLLTYLAMFAVLFFTPVGVLSVTSAFLKKYMARLFISLDVNSKNNTRGAAEKFFMVPEIVDVKRVEMDPELDYKEFNIGVATHMWWYVIILVVILSSNLFLNPFFLDTMTTNQMLAIMLMLSMFVPAMIIPWQVVMDLNAKVISDAPRPYYLWTGARRRLFGAFITLGAFSVMFFLALYYGYSIWSMLINYVYLMLPLSFIAMMYAAMYTNNFNNELKAVIYMKYMEGIGKADERKE